MTTKPKHVGTVKIGTESYNLVQTDEQQAWQEHYLHEPPWSEGLPATLSEPAETWHLGGLKSKQGIPGTSEYGKNTDARFPFRLLPGPKVVSIQLSDIPVSIFEALGYIWVLAGQYAFRVDPATDEVTMSKNFGAGVRCVMGLRWENDTGLVTTDEADQSLWEVTAIGTPDTWTQAEAGVKAYRLASGIDRLFGIEDSGLLRNCVTGNDPLLSASWSDQIQCGETSTKPTGLVAFEKTVLAGKPEGLFGVSPEGKGVPLIKRMIRDDDNCKGMHVHEPYVIVPHSRGAYRYLPGQVESIGLEMELLNESPVRGRFTAFATDNRWLIGALRIGAVESYLMMGRDRTGGEPGFGPMIWDTWTHKESAAAYPRTMHLSTLTDPPRLWFGLGYTISYIELSEGAGAPDVEGSGYKFATSGLRYTHRYNFGDWRGKDFPKVVVVGKGTLSATRYWDIYYSVDGADYSALDIDSATMRVDSDGLHTFYLPLSAVGREIQFRLDFTGDSETAPPELSYFEPFAVPQSKKIPVNVIQLHLVADETEGERREVRTAAQQLSDLHTLDESSSPLKASGPWGEDKDMWLKSLRLVSVIQESGLEAEYLVEVTLQERKVS